MKISISILGRGGEIVAGKVDRKIYDYFKENKINIENYSNDLVEVPDEYHFLEGGPWDCDNLYHECGGYLGNSSIVVWDEDNDELIWESEIDYNSLEREGVEIFGDVITDLEDIIEPDEIAFCWNHYEKGIFYNFIGELNEPFDPKKLSINVVEIGEKTIHEMAVGVEYEGVELELVTIDESDSKGIDAFWYLGSDVEPYEPEDESFDDDMREEYDFGLSNEDDFEDE